MTLDSYTVGATLRRASKLFRLGEEGSPDLVRSGIGVFDDRIGGFSPGSAAILAAATNVGKSRAMMYMATHTPEPCAIVSVEDPEDVVGSRLYAAATGIDGLDIRRKNISPGQEKALLKLVDNPPFPNIKYLGYPIAGKLEEVTSHITRARDAGARLIFLDYLQEVRGHNVQRNHEVVETLAACHRAASVGDDPAVIIGISQLRRLEDPMKPPSIHHLKESGDLENKARIIILAHRALREDGKTWCVKFNVGKSTYGGVGLSWDMVTTEAGTLEMAPAMDAAKEVRW